MIKNNIHVSDKMIAMDKVIEKKTMVKNSKKDFANASELDRVNEKMPSQLKDSNDDGQMVDQHDDHESDDSDQKSD